MNTTILTDEQIMHLWDTRVGDPTECMPLVDSDKTAFARAIEQAVLQSYESQLLRLLVDIRFAAGDDGKRMQDELVDHIGALRKDAERLDWLESCEDSHGFCHAGYGDYIYYAHQVTGMPSVREVIDAAMGNSNDASEDA